MNAGDNTARHVRPDERNHMEKESGVRNKLSVIIATPDGAGRLRQSVGMANRFRGEQNLISFDDRAFF